MEKRRKAMLEMPELIKAWKRVRSAVTVSIANVFNANARHIGREEELDQVAEINAWRTEVHSLRGCTSTMYSYVQIHILSQLLPAHNARHGIVAKCPINILREDIYKSRDTPT